MVEEPELNGREKGRLGLRTWLSVQECEHHKEPSTFPALGRSCSKNKEGLGFPASFLSIFPLCSQPQACVFLLPLITSFQLCTPGVFDTVWGPQTFPFLSLAPNCNHGLTSCLDASPNPNYMPNTSHCLRAPHHCLPHHHHHTHRSTSPATV